MLHHAVGAAGAHYAFVGATQQYVALFEEAARTVEPVRHTLIGQPLLHEAKHALCLVGGVEQALTLQTFDGAWQVVGTVGQFEQVVQEFALVNVRLLPFVVVGEVAHEAGRLGALPIVGHRVLRVDVR